MTFGIIWWDAKVTVREETDLWKENPWMLGKLNIEEGIEMAKKNSQLSMVREIVCLFLVFCDISNILKSFTGFTNCFTVMAE